MPIQEHLNNVIKTGISPGQTFADKRDILFTNKAAFALTIACLLVASAYLYFGFFYGSLIPFLVAFAMNATYPLQHFGHNFLAKITVFGDNLWHQGKPPLLHHWDVGH
jgi:hypothetical protein